MSECPVCNRYLNLDETALIRHINNHFEGPSSRAQEEADSPDANTEGAYHHAQPSREPPYDTCIICGYPLSFLSGKEGQIHLNGCLDDSSFDGELYGDRGNDKRDFDFTEQALGGLGQPREDNWVADGWDGPARPGGWSDWVDRKVDRGDKWWDPVNGSMSSSDIPSNVSPGIAPVLAQILNTAVQQRFTRSAVLCGAAVHIKGVWGFDMTWGCGYRNALMALSSLLISQPGYRLLFSREINGSDPGVRRMQGWIEQAWGNGFDRVGRGELKGKVLGTRKWIGTSELWAMFRSKNIPCDLYDFPKPQEGSKGPKTAHIALQEWVKYYFLAEDLQRSSSASSRQRSAYDIMMRPAQNGVGRGEPVRISDRYPLILQHSGHSRTIIGYEENTSGNINLLLLDPARTMPKDIRNAGIQDLPRQRRQPFRPPLPSKASSGSRSHEPKAFSPPYTNGASEIVTLPADAELSDVDEPMPGKDRRPNPAAAPWKGEVVKSLGYFRANLGALAAHTEYQILAFTGGPILSNEERDSKKVIRSICIR